MGFWNRKPTIKCGTPRYLAATAGPTSQACVPAAGTLPVGNTKVGPIAQPNPVSFEFGQLETNKSKSCTSPNSVEVELLDDVASCWTVNTAPDSGTTFCSQFSLAV